MLIHLYQLREGKQVAFVIDHALICTVEAAQEGGGATIGWRVGSGVYWASVSDSPAVVWAIVRRIQEAEFPNLRLNQPPARE